MFPCHKVFWLLLTIGDSNPVGHWPSNISNTGSMMTIGYFEYWVHAGRRLFWIPSYADHRLFRILRPNWPSIISNTASVLTIDYFQYCVCADHRLFPILGPCWPSIISNSVYMLNIGDLDYWILTIDYFDYSVSCLKLRSNAPISSAVQVFVALVFM